MSFLLHSGHFLVDRTAVSMQDLQKTWPHVVVHGSRGRTSSRQTGHLYHISAVLSSSAERARFGGDGLVEHDVTKDVSRCALFARAAVLVASELPLRRESISGRGTGRRDVSGEHKSIIASGERSLAVRGWTSKLDRSIISIGSPDLQEETRLDGMQTIDIVEPTVIRSAIGTCTSNPRRR